MWQFIRTLVVLVIAFISMTLAQLGWMWCEQGVGLHPAIAYPLATVGVTGCIVLLLVIFAEGEDIQFNNAFEAIAGLLRIGDKA